MKHISTIFGVAVLLVLFVLAALATSDCAQAESTTMCYWVDNVLICNTV